MPLADSPELFWLVLTALMTALFWIVYVLQLFAQEGPFKVILAPAESLEHKPLWARRAKYAHANAIENLAVFAPLALAVAVLDASTPATAMAAMIYFAARAAHFLVYWLGVPVLRTLAFLTGWACQIAIALSLLGLI